MGLAVGVERLDKRQVNLRKKILQTRSHFGCQNKSAVAMQRTTKSLQEHAVRTCTLVSQLLQLSV
jgi:hypothetical protein